MVNETAPCLKALDAECFKARPAWAKRAFAYRLVHMLTPKALTRRLPRILRQALLMPGAQWNVGDPYPPGTIDPGMIGGFGVGSQPIRVPPWEPGPINQPGRYSPVALGVLTTDTFYPAHSEDDGAWCAASYWTSVANEIRAGYYVFASPWNMYIIFKSIGIEGGATIHSATLTLTSYSTLAGPSAYWRVYGNDVDNPAQPTGYADCDALDLTDAWVNWTPVEWTINVQYSPGDIGDIVQEIVNRPGWTINNDIMIIVKDLNIGEDYREAFSFNAGVSAKYPALEINWYA